ncbi:MAG: hypothetical protein NUV34_07435 [Sulfuricaulis sp.]|nr:hypothetical protein [Sulfuricaulis sp.]
MLTAKDLTGESDNDWHRAAFEGGANRTRDFLRGHMNDIETVTIPAEAERRLLEYVRDMAPSRKGV